MRRSATAILLLAALALSACVEPPRSEPFGNRSGGYSYGGPGNRSAAAEAALLRNQLMLERARNDHRAARYEALIDRNRHGRHDRYDRYDRDDRPGRRDWQDRDHDDRARHERDLRRDRERRDAAERDRAREVRYAEQNRRDEVERRRREQDARSPRRSGRPYAPDGATSVGVWHRDMVGGSAR